MSNYLFSPLDEPFRETFPPLSITVNMAPMAHVETKFYQGRAITDPLKRAYMTMLAGTLREWKGWFKGLKRIHLNLVLVFERTLDKPEGYSRAEWNDPDLELVKITSPDLDNCEKSIQDCLSNHRIQKERRSKRTWTILDEEIRGAGIIDDDEYIVSKETYKIYHKPLELPRIEINLSEAPRYFNPKRNK